MTSSKTQMMREFGDMLAAPREGGPDLASALPSAMLLTSKEASKLQKAIAVAALGRMVYSAVREAYRERRTTIPYVITIGSEDMLYSEILSWVLEKLPSVERRSLSAVSRYTDGATLKVRMLYDGSRHGVVEIDGHEVMLVIDNGGGSAPQGPEEPARRRSLLSQPKIVMQAATAEGRDAIIRLLDNLATNYRDQGPQIYFSTKWGNWNRMPAQRARRLDSVVLDGDLKNEIVADMGRFLEGEQFYTELGIPWHRGYLFHGPPGTGKTSLASALANHFQLNMYFISLSGIDDDSALQEMVNSVDHSRRSMLVLEDIDIVHSAREREDNDDKESKGVTLGGLLNALDGLATPHGMITVMTTNRLDVLDEALIRPGRADAKIELGFLTDQQLQGIWNRLTDSAPAEFPRIGDRKITPAELIGIFKKHIEFPAKAYDDIVQLIKTRWP